MARRKTPEEVAWLLDNAPLNPMRDTLALFADRFGWAPTRSSLASWMCGKGIRPPNSPMRWTADMDACFREIVPGRSESEIADLFEDRFGIHLTPSMIGNRKTRLGIRSGTVGGRFEPGCEPANKGRTWDEMGLSPEAQARCRATCFGAGEEPPNGARVPTGAERTSKDGYVEVKVKRFSDTPGANQCWRAKHQIVWEEANGRPVPPSSMIVFADRDKRNFDPDNLVCVPRAEWAVIAKKGIGYRDRDTLLAAVAVAKLARVARRAELSGRERDQMGSCESNTKSRGGPEGHRGGC